MSKEDKPREEDSREKPEEETPQPLPPTPEEYLSTVNEAEERNIIKKQIVEENED